MAKVSLIGSSRGSDHHGAACSRPTSTESLGLCLVDELVSLAHVPDRLQLVPRRCRLSRVPPAIPYPSPVSLLPPGQRPRAALRRRRPRPAEDHVLALMADTDNTPAFPAWAIASRRAHGLST